MSSRMLKKLHGENEKIVDEAALSDLETELSAATIPIGGGGGAKKKQLNVNRYDLLLPQSPSESEVKEDDNDTEYLSSAAEQAKKKKKKRKKKGGGKYGGSSHRRSSEDNADVSDMSVSRTTFSVRNPKLEERETDDILDNFTALSPKLLSVTTAKVKALLNIQHKNLNPVNEMRRMFGSKVIQSEKTSGRLVKNKRSRNARVAAISTSRTTWLVTPKDTWQPVTRIGISMNLAHPHHGDLQVSSPTGSPLAGSAPGTNSQASGGSGSSDVIFFNFEHSKAYRALQERFLAAVESNDTENIVRILDAQPYHIDSLIQLGELCKMSEEMATAADLIEHVIYALETAFHPMFSLTAGNCRLDYRRQENRALFVALFKHAQYLEGRACPRTALEIAKLILTFDPVGDPLAMILALDYYAIRARQFEWLIELYKEWETSHNLAQLPNMAYSYAMAEFYEEKNRGDGTVTEKADAALQYALLMFPGVLKPLVEEIGVQIDSRVANHNYFGVGALKTQPVALQQLTALYVCRSKLVWRDAELLPWLERNTNAVLDRVDAKDEVVAEYAAKRTARYKNPPREILRHIVLSDYKEKVPLMPFVLKETEPIVMYDPLPPLDSINIYTRFQGPAAARTFFNRNASSLSMFFQSLLPSFQVPPGAVPADGQPAGEAAGVARGAAEGGNAAGEEGAVGGDAAAATRAAGAPAEGEENANSIRSSLDTMNEFLRYFLSNARAENGGATNNAGVQEDDDDATEDDEEDNDST